MTPERFTTMVDAYGGAPERWPDGERDEALAYLAATPAGRALVPKLSALADRNDEEFFGHLKRPERAMIENAMKEIVRLHALRAVPVE